MLYDLQNALIVLMWIFYWAYQLSDLSTEESTKQRNQYGLLTVILIVLSVVFCEWTDVFVYLWLLKGVEIVGVALLPIFAHQKKEWDRQAEFTDGIR